MDEKGCAGAGCITCFAMFLIILLILAPPHVPQINILVFSHEKPRHEMLEKEGSLLLLPGDRLNIIGPSVERIYLGRSGGKIRICEIRYWDTKAVTYTLEFSDNKNFRMFFGDSVFEKGPDVDGEPDKLVLSYKKIKKEAQK